MSHAPIAPRLFRINLMSKDLIIARLDEVYLTRITGTDRRRTTNPQKPRARHGQHEEKDHEDHASCRRRSPQSRHRSAYADSEGGQVANTRFTSIPGFLAQAPAQNAPAVATAQNGQAVRAYVTQSSHGTWLFPPHEGGGNNG